MYSNLQISHVFKYGNRLSDLMKEKGVLEGPAFFAVRTKKNKKERSSFYYPGNRRGNGATWIYLYRRLTERRYPIYRKAFR